MNFVEVSDGKISVHLPVKNNSLSTQTIRAYFPNVSGLTFINENNKRCGLSILNDKFELLPGVNKYEVHSCNILKGNYLYILVVQSIHIIFAYTMNS